MGIQTINFNNRNEQTVKNEDQGKLTTKEENQLKMLQAHGYKEMSIYNNLVNEFIKNVSELAIFEKMFNDFLGSQVRTFLSVEILDALTKPVFEGNNPPFMDESHYSEIRLDMYKNLVSKYIDKIDDNPF